MKKITNDWLLSAESDLAIIDRIIDQPNLTHQVAFHAQQVVEKSFKAIIEEFEIGFIKTHSLNALYSKVEDKIEMVIDSDLISLLDQLYIDSRYPGEMGLLPDGKPSRQQAVEFYEFAISILKSVRSALE